MPRYLQTGSKTPRPNLSAVAIVLIAGALNINAQTENPPPNIDPDRFYELSPKMERERLDNVFIQLSNNLGEGVIEIQFDQRDTRRVRIDRIRRILQHVRFRKIDVRRISFRISESSYHVTTYWLVNDEFRWLLVEDAYHKVVKAEEFERTLHTIFPKTP